MSRSRSQQHARRPQLPYLMRQELGIPEQRRQRTHISERKQKRQEARKENKPRPNKRQKITHHVESEDDTDAQFEAHDDQSDIEEQEGSSEELDSVSYNRTQSKPLKTTGKPRNEPLPSPSPSSSSGALDEFDEDDEDVLSRGSREYSPEVVLDKNSKAFQEKQAEEDAEILALEKKLGMKSKKGKRERIFDDGFDDLLEDLEGATDITKSKREADEWLQSKRAKAAMNGTKSVSQPGGGDNDDDKENNEDVSEDDFAGFEDEHEDEDDEADLSDSIEGEGENDEDDEDDEEELPEVRKPSKTPRENPYVAPTTNATTAKYVPPSRRKAPEGDTEVLQKLRKQAQGSLNKLSEANIISIIDEFSKLYQNYPRQDVTDTTIDLILTAFAIPTTLTNTYIILHAAFISALYKIHGPDFGAEIVSKLVETFDKHQASPGKESLNLTSLLANLFTFHLTSSILIFDHIRALLSSFGSSTSNSEDSAEHLLRIIRDCGPQLRSDDPTALKGIVAMMNETAAKMTADGSKINIRTRVMMDTITDLKNNKTRHNTNSAGVTGEHLTRMRKALGSLSNRQLRGTEPLNLSRADILNSDKKGKWWLIGASWKGHSDSHPNPSNSTNPPTQQINTTITANDDEHEADPLDPINIRSLAQSHNLTTPLRLSIFTALITAHSPPDALSRLTKLRLTRRQEPEIPRVLLTLCRAEPSFNPYYAALARQLLREKNHKMAFSIALWKFFGELGERGDQDGDDDDEDGYGGDGRGKEVGVSEIANVARLYARLVAKGCLKLDILKTLSIGVLGERAGMWLEVFFIALLAQNKLDEEGIVRIFGTCEERLRKGIAWFLRKDVRRSDLLVDKLEKEKVKKGCKLVEAAFAAVEEEDMD